MQKKSFTQRFEELLYNVGASLTLNCKNGKDCMSKKHLAYVVSRRTPEAPGKLRTSVDYVAKTVVVTSVLR